MELCTSEVCARDVGLEDLLRFSSACSLLQLSFGRSRCQRAQAAVASILLISVSDVAPFCVQHFI